MFRGSHCSIPYFYLQRGKLAAILRKRMQCLGFYYCFRKDIVTLLPFIFDKCVYMDNKFSWEKCLMLGYQVRISHFYNYRKILSYGMGIFYCNSTFREHVAQKW